jgi:exodeoxyribonuclease VII large subunit
LRATPVNSAYRCIQAPVLGLSVRRVRHMPRPIRIEPRDLAEMSSLQVQAGLDFGRDIYSISRLNSEVRAVLDGSFPLVWVQGEVSNLAQPSSGHLYFSLKDEAAQVRCALFRPKRLLLRFRPANGQQVLARARVSLFEPRGDYQLICEHLEPAGEGALRLELERLKQRLAAEGLFDPSAKRPLPSFPRQIGVLTSPIGAALHDILSVLGRRLASLPVLVYPIPVQGAGAAAEVVAALALANRRAECDVLILARGGGSLEDLWAFNDEALARAIRASAIPVVAGIGHEVDFTIADLAADQRAATPSAAAEMVSPSGEHLAHRVLALHGRLVTAQVGCLAGLVQRLGGAARHLRLLHPAAALQRRGQMLDDLERRLCSAMAERVGRAWRRLDPTAARLAVNSPAHGLPQSNMRLQALRRRLILAAEHAVSGRRDRLALAAQGLDARSPLSTLARGYAIVSSIPDGKILRDASQVVPGSLVLARLARGALTCRVEAAADLPVTTGSG